MSSLLCDFVLLMKDVLIQLVLTNKEISRVIFGVRGDNILNLLLKANKIRDIYNYCCILIYESNKLIILDMNVL